MLKVQKIDVSYGIIPALKGVSLKVADGEMVSILGPSGAGKTTILKAVAGLIEPVGGDIRLDGKSLAGVPPDKRNTVMVFQKPLLFPFMNVEQNIAFGLKMRGMAQRQTRRAVEDILALTQLALEALDAARLALFFVGCRHQSELHETGALDPMA